MGNDSPPHSSPNLHLNLKFKMLKRKLRSEMGLLNTLQKVSVRPLDDFQEAALENLPRVPQDSAWTTLALFERDRKIQITFEIIFVNKKANHDS